MIRPKHTNPVIPEVVQSVLLYKSAAEHCPISFSPLEIGVTKDITNLSARPQLGHVRRDAEAPNWKVENSIF
jgi:hypothetical protein